MAQAHVILDEPTPFDTLQTWERHLSLVESLPADQLGRDRMLVKAKRTIRAKATKTA